MPSASPVEKLQSLLQTIFQFESADLDFGIYRIMNCKRDVILKFIEKDLVKAISEELKKGSLADQSRAAKEFQEVKGQLLETLGKDAIDGEGNLADQYKGTEIGKKYLYLKEKAVSAKDSDALETQIFNHLFTFFSRYYDNGDFHSKRRYSKKEKYAIPYNGEEVYLHWANSDQYYIKTSEHFTDYAYSYSGIKVHFKLQNAQTDPDNIKGDKRFFIPISKEATFDSKAGEILVPFEYRELSEKELISFGKKNQQEAIIAQALKDIPERFKKDATAQAAFLAERRKTSDGSSVNYLEHHLRRYTRRNTSDFFIHKNLKVFLDRELDFYLKNEVLNLEEIEAAGERLSTGWFQILKVIKNIASKIIDFLAQIEDFQKKLFEKKKFITQVGYCIIVGSIPESFYPDIATNDTQWKEWKELFHINEEASNLFNSGKDKKGKRVDFLKERPTLTLDTKYFETDFQNRLLNSIDDLEGKTDGLLFHAENFQALNLILHKYAKSIHCVYIDPPYNTGGDGFPYKDAYQHSSWMSMFENRLEVARPLLNPRALLFVHIDNGEQARLRLLGENALGQNTFHAMIAWKNKYGPGAATRGIGDLHEHIVVFSLDPSNTLTAPLDEETISQYSGRDSKFNTRGGFVTQPLATRSKDPRPNLVYPIYYKGKEILPDKQWIWSRERMETAIANDEVVFNQKADDSFSVRFKQYLRDEQGRMRRGKPLSLLLGPFNQDGTKEVENLFGERAFAFPKPAALGQRLLAIQADEWHSDTIVLDYLAGSGTTGHAVINLNREDGGKREFMLVEMGEHFDTVLLPRIKKVIFSPEWKNGKPKRIATKEEAERSPRIIKYVRLESYEDALNNIAFTLPKGQKTLEFDDYLLNYMLDWETKDSDTLLNVEKLASPFSYELNITEGQETKKKPVDLSETFNYLLGLHVKTRKVLKDKKREYLVYSGTVDSREVVVIWRDIKNWKKKDFDQEKEFIKKEKLTEEADEIFVNGDSLIPDAKSLDPVFKSRMFGGL